MTDKTSDVIERLNKYLSLMRYKYSTEERLKRLNILIDYYASKNKVGTEEKLSSSIDFVEQLSKKLTLPLKVKGVFLSEGRPLKKWYSAEELKKSVNNPLNRKFPLMLDHEDTKAGKIIGQVDGIEFDEDEKVLRWWGHINDETFARNVLDGTIKQVSATIYSVKKWDDNYGLVGIDLVYKELSLVMGGQEPKNSIEVDD